MTDSNLISEKTDKIFEIWMGSLYKSIHELHDLEEITNNREKIAQSVKEYFNNNLRSLFVGLFDDFTQIDPKETIRYDSINDKNGNIIRDGMGLEVKLLRFPRFKILVDDFCCVLGIRINICAGENLSKVWLYIRPSESNVKKLNSEQIFYTLQNFKEKLKKIHERIGQKYVSMGNSEDFKFKIYVYNIGSNHLDSFLSETDFKNIANKIKVDAEIQRYYLDILGLTHNKYFKNFEDYKNSKIKEHIWGLRRLTHGKSEIKTLFAQQISQNGESICAYSGISNTDDVKALHEMDRSVILGILTRF